MMSSLMEIKEEAEKPRVSPCTGILLIAFAEDGSFSVRGAGAINCENAETVAKSLTIVASQIRNSVRPGVGLIQ